MPYGQFANPSIPSSTVMLQDKNKYLFLLPERPDWIIVNRNMAKLLSLCDGSHSLAELCTIACSGKNPRQSMDDFTSILSSDFFSSKTNKISYTSHLFSLHLNMTSQCNLCCVYCYAEERPKNNESLLSKEEYFRLIDQVAEISPDCVITFTGGEPLLNNMTITLAEYAKKKKLGTFLLTNAIAVTQNNAKKIARFFDSVRVSLDGRQPVHDKLRGKGSYENTMKGINILKKFGKIPEIAMTVTKWNIDEIAFIVEQFSSALTLQPLYSVGRARQHDLVITGEEYFNALNSIKSVEPYGKIQEHLAQIRNHGCERCAIGEGEISISPSGDVYPCHMLHEPSFLAGNIRTDSFKNIYENSPILKKIRSYSVNTRKGCASCPIRLICGGACWARAFYSEGDINTADKFCIYEQLAFTQALFNSAKTINTEE